MFPNDSIIYASIIPPANNKPTTIPTSTAICCHCFRIGSFLTSPTIRIKLRDMAIEYAASSINPNGVAKIIAIGGIFANNGSVVERAANANPVENAEKIPQPTPNPGMNIGNAICVL